MKGALSQVAALKRKKRVKKATGGPTALKGVAGALLGSSSSSPTLSQYTPPTIGTNYGQGPEQTFFTRVDNPDYVPATYSPSTVDTGPMSQAASDAAINDFQAHTGNTGAARGGPIRGRCGLRKS